MKKANFGPVMLRIILGLLFVIPGVSKLMGMLSGGHGVVDMLWGSAALAWLLLLVEIVAGAALLLGWKVEWMSLPLIVVMIGAIFIAVIPNMNGSPVNLLFHLLAIASLGSLTVTGPGAYAVDSA